MKILQLCKKFPFPLKDGESIAITNLGKSLGALKCEITLLAMNTSKHYFDSEVRPLALGHYKAVHSVDVDNRVKAIDAFIHLFKEDSYNISRFVSSAFEEKLIQLLQADNFDVVQLETLYLAPYIPIIRRYSNAVVAMRAHNVEHEIWQRMTSNTAFFLKRWYLRHLTGRLEAYEVQQLHNYDILLPITERDLHSFEKAGYSNRAVVTPIGLDCSRYTSNYESYAEDLSISFIGSLDWMPNIEGLKWFLDTTWDRLAAKFPNLKLHIAGRNTPSWLKNLNKKNIIVHGEVDCAVTFINAHSIMIVPLLSGSGMRAKILEGMALGKVVLTTNIGLEGITATHKDEVLIANKAEEFINCIQYCYDEREALRFLGQRAENFVKTNYNCQKIAEQLLKAYQAARLPEDNAFVKQII